MIKNSDLFFNRLSEFQTKRKGIVDEYESTLARLEKAKGSQLYTEETEKATKKRDAELEALQSEYRGYFKISIDAMSEANGKRGVTPPTADQLAILQALKMRDTVTEKELARAANSCADNAMCISVINELAKKNGIIRGFHCTAKELSTETADRFIKDLQDFLPDFMAHDTSKAARIAADHNARLYGTTGNEKPLPKRPLFEDKAGGYAELTHGILSGENLDLFCAAVDGDE